MHNCLQGLVGEVDFKVTLCSEKENLPVWTGLVRIWGLWLKVSRMDMSPLWDTKARGQSLSLPQGRGK